jgi:chromosomal replication initiation ATPase DnaA
LALVTDTWPDPGRQKSRLLTPLALSATLRRVTLGRQLALPFPHRDRYDPHAFLRGPSNAEAIAWLESEAAWPNLRLAIHGEPGAGKTHLLHRFAARHAATLVPAGTLRGLPRLPPQGAIAIDDADTTPEPLALLHLLNAAAEARLPVLLAGAEPPARWRKTLPDLDSRLCAITAVRLRPPDDALLRALLARLIAERQLRVEEPVQAYLLARLPRSCAALREAASRLDRASLAAGKRVTRALAADMLAQLQVETEAELLPDEDSVPVSRQASPLDGSLL